MKRIRTALLLSIFVFISTLFWPQLLAVQHQLLVATLAVALLFVPTLRILAVIPVTALYFTLYANLTLTGQVFPLTPLLNKNALATFVDGQDHNIDVQIISLISNNNRGYFKAKLLVLDTDHLNYAPLIEMRWYKPDVNLQAGQIHRFVVRFKPVYGRANPGGFDRQKWSYSEHVAYQATIKKHLLMVNQAKTLRSVLYEKVQLATNNLKHQGLLLALSFADKSLIPFLEKRRIRDLGISHLFAISGLHIGLVFTVFYLVANIIIKRYLAASKMGWFSLRLINITALIGAGFYVYLAGFALPTQRAFLMLLVAITILSLKRKCTKKDLLLLVLFVVLIWDPLAVLSISLWLSFYAVAILLALLWAFPISPKNTEYGNNYPLITPLFKYIKLLFWLQIGLTLLMIPIQLISFSGLSLVAIIVNLFAVPLFSFVIIPITLIGVLGTFISATMGTFLFSISNIILKQFFALTQFVGEGYLLFSDAEESLFVVIFCGLLLLFILHFKMPQHRRISYFFSALILCLMTINFSKTKQQWLVDVIDVGQGSAILIRSEQQALLYDTGARYASGFNMVDSEIAPYLISLGIKQIDHLVISHSDNDHAGGADIIATQFKIINRWSGEPLKSISPFQQCLFGDKWYLGSLKVEVLSPRKLTANNNNNSCVLRISDASRSILLTGDIGKNQEHKLVKQFGEKLKSDILIAPHHGSRYSSSKIFIEAVSPQWAVFSAGFMNHWGFPSDDVISRYQKQSVKTFNSGLTGLIRFQISAQAIKIKTFREDLAPYWYHHSFLP